MGERAKDPNFGRNSWFIWLENQYYRLQFWFNYYGHFISDRFSQTGWTILFSVLFLYFVYALCFISESKRISNESAKMGAFIMALFILLSTVQNTKFYRQL